MVLIIVNHFAITVYHVLKGIFWSWWTMYYEKYSGHGWPCYKRNIVILVHHVLKESYDHCWPCFKKNILNHSWPCFKKKSEHGWPCFKKKSEHGWPCFEKDSDHGQVFWSWLTMFLKEFWTMFKKVKFFLFWIMVEHVLVARPHYLQFSFRIGNSCTTLVISPIDPRAILGLHGV